MPYFLQSQPESFKQLLDAIQKAFPLEPFPFNTLANRFQLDTELLIETLNNCIYHNVIRQVGPFFEPRKLGYFSTLIAAAVPDNLIETVAQFVSRHPGVSHNYQRNHLLNLWFTVAAPSPDAIEAYLNKLKKTFGLHQIYSLPTIKMFKLNVQFNLSDNTPQPTSSPLPHQPQASTVPISLTPSQQAFIRKFQKGLPIIDRPYLFLAESLDLTENQVIDQIQNWIDQGIIRRIAARLKHQKIGFSHNAMVVFDLPDGQIDAAGAQLAALPFVSHCYQRPSVDLWPYTLFAMTHAHSAEQIQQAVQQMVDLIAPRQYDVLSSIREFKKEPVQYFIDPA